MRKSTVRSRMTGDIKETDLEYTLPDSGSIFTSLKKLRDHPRLTRKQKITILRSWAYDASEVAVAEEEGMMSGEPSHLAEILSVLHHLAGGCDTEHRPTTKQGGV